MLRKSENTVMKSMVNEALQDIKTYFQKQIRNSPDILQKLYKIESEVNYNVDQILKDISRKRGYCHVFLDDKEASLKGRIWN